MSHKSIGRTLLILIAIPVTIFIIRQIIMSVGNARALKALSVVEMYSSDYYSKNGTYEGFCTDEKVNTLTHPFISKPKISNTGNEALDKELNSLKKQEEEQYGGRVYCFGDKESYEVSIRFKLNDILERYCQVRNIDEKPYCSHDTP